VKNLKRPFISQLFHVKDHLSIKKDIQIAHFEDGC